MSSGELVVLIASLLVAILVWALWVWESATVARSFSRARGRGVLFVMPVLSAWILIQVLASFASFDVRDDAGYFFLYVCLGAAWVGVAVWALLPFFGLSARDDVLERQNPAAAYAVSGALVGTTLCFAGGNIGDGPGWWVVVFSALLSTGAFFLLWVLLDKLTGLADVVTIDRDPAAGLRLGGFFIASGLILGRAVAGNWASFGVTVLDFVRSGWPVVALLLLAAFLEKQSSPPRLDRSVSALLGQGVVPAVAYLGFAAAVVAIHGPWS